MYIYVHVYAGATLFFFSWAPDDTSMMLIEQHIYTYTCIYNTTIHTIMVTLYMTYL